MGIATIDVLLMHCLEWTSHVSVHANLKVPIDTCWQARTQEGGGEGLGVKPLPFSFLYVVILEQTPPPPFVNKKIMPMADLKKVTPPPPQRNKMSNFQISRQKKEKKCHLTPAPPPPAYSATG